MNDAIVSAFFKSSHENMLTHQITSCIPNRFEHTPEADETKGHASRLVVCDAPS